MALVVYSLCALASLVCAFLLIRGYRSNRTRFLFWSALCFFVLAVSNLLLFVDLVIWAEVDLSLLRTAVTLVALGFMLYGLIFETEP
jgi:hypothetical protein